MTTINLHGAAAQQNVVYVYGVARAPCGWQAGSPQVEGIVPEAPVLPLVHADLVAFVSEVPAAWFGLSEFRSALNDVEWLKDRILAHEKVLEKLRFSYDVVPFRFGTIYLDSSHASNAIARHRREFCRALDRVRDASEWGIKLYCDQDMLCRKIESESPAILQLRDELGRSSPGARFFFQKRYAKALDGEAETMIRRSLERIRQRLDTCASESTEIEVQPAAAHGRPAEMIMNAAYLVTTGSMGKLRQTIADLREECAPQGLSFELTGPWPPYHFVSIRQEGIADAATSDQ
jgi:hypothetical protein